MGEELGVTEGGRLAGPQVSATAAEEGVWEEVQGVEDGGRRA